MSTMNFSPKTKLNLIIGNPVEHSLSPKLHNFVYQKMGIEKDFVFLASSLETKNLELFLKNMKNINLNSLTVTIPFKEKVMEFLDEISPVASTIGAVNTIIKKDQKLVGDNTDWLGTLIPLYEKWTNSEFKYQNEIDLQNLLQKPFLKNQKTILFGSGGASRAMAFAVLKAGSDLTIISRNLEKAQKIKLDLEKDFPNNKIKAILGNSTEIKDEIITSKILINATPLGMGKLQNQSSMDDLEDLIKPEMIFFDAVYKPFETKFLKSASAKKAKTINGLEMLIWQAVFQFKLQTKQFAEVDFFREGLI